MVRKNLKTPGLQNKLDPGAPFSASRLPAIVSPTVLLLKVPFPFFCSWWVPLHLQGIFQITGQNELYSGHAPPPPPPKKAHPSVLAAVMLFLSSGWQVCLHCWAEPLEKLDQACLLSGTPQPGPGPGREHRGPSQCLMRECSPSAVRVLRTNWLGPEPGLQLACTLRTLWMRDGDDQMY